MPTHGRRRPCDTALAGCHATQHLRECHGTQHLRGAMRHSTCGGAMRHSTCGVPPPFPWQAATCTAVDAPPLKHIFRKETEEGPMATAVARAEAEVAATQADALRRIHAAAAEWKEEQARA
eukprot:3913975-Prymnesium_polylepis.2